MAGQPITLTIPAVGTPGTAYAAQINAALTALEVELERKVVPADMSINADLSFLSGVLNSSATDLKRLGLSLQNEAVLTAASFPMSLFAAGGDGELYFNDNSGRQIQITTNGTVNVSTSGGINSSAGTYGTSGVEIRWDSGDLEYEMRTGSGLNDYASVRINDVYLSDASSNFVRLTAQAMAADYVVTLPAAVPASTSVVLMDSVGTLSTTRAVAVDTIATTNTITSTGLITAAAGVTAAANQHITISGTGRFKHGSLVRSCAPFPAVFLGNGGSGGAAQGVTIFEWIATAAGDTVYVPIHGLDIGERITAIKFIGNDAGAGTFWRGNLHVFNEALGTSAVVGGNADSGTAATGRVTATVTGLASTIAADSKHYVKWTSGAANDSFSGFEVTYDRP